MGGRSGGGGPSAEQLKQQRFNDSREYWTSYQEQRRNIVDQRADAMKDLAQMTAVGGLSGRAAKKRREQIEADYDRQWNTLHTGSTWGLLEDVYREQGATGSLQDYFGGQWGFIEPLEDTDARSPDTGADAQRAAAMAQDEEQQRQDQMGQVYEMT